VAQGNSSIFVTVTTQTFSGSVPSRTFTCSGTYGIYAHDMKDCAIRSCQISRFGTGTFLDGDMYHSAFTDSSWRGNNDGFVGDSSYVNGTNFIGCEFSNNTDDGMDISYSGEPVNIIGCRVEDNGGYGILLGSASQVNVSGTYFQGNDAGDAYIESQGFNNAIVNWIGNEHAGTETNHYSLILEGVAVLNAQGNKFHAFKSTNNYAISFVNNITRGVMIGNEGPKAAGTAIMSPSAKSNFFWSNAEDPSITIGANASIYSVTNQKGSFVHNNNPETNGGILGWVISTAGAGSSAAALSGVTGTTTAGSTTVTVNKYDGIFPGCYITIAGETFGTASAVRVLKIVSATSLLIQTAADTGVTGAAVAYQTSVFKRVSGMIYDRNVAAVSTSGTGEDQLRYTIIPAAMMETTSGFHIFAAGTKSGAGGNKTLKFYFGATAITFHAAANNENPWRFEAYIYNTNNASAQGISWIGYDGNTILQGYDTATVDTSAPVTMKITGECTNGADTITQTLWLVEPK
jgi:hypothetical protein